MVTLGVVYAPNPTRDHSRVRSAVNLGVPYAPNLTSDWERCIACQVGGLRKADPADALRGAERMPYGESSLEQESQPERSCVTTCCQTTTSEPFPATCHRPTGDCLLRGTLEAPGERGPS